MEPVEYGTFEVAFLTEGDKVWLCSSVHVVVSAPRAELVVEAVVVRLEGTLRADVE